MAGVCVRSPLIMLEYLNNPKANAENFLPGRWVDTGDLGQLIEGRLHIESRMRDMIIRGGENIYPAEIENRIELHPDVAEVAVHGVDDRELGQKVKAVIVPNKGAEPTRLLSISYAVSCLKTKTFILLLVYSYFYTLTFILLLVYPYHLRPMYRLYLSCFP
mgnify:CR=1 FL=1